MQLSSCRAARAAHGVRSQQSAKNAATRTEGVRRARSPGTTSSTSDATLPHTRTETQARTQ